MLPKRVYLIGLTSIFALGYCSGHGCREKTPIPATPSLTTVPLPVAPIEQQKSASQPTSSPIILPVVEPVSAEQQLLDFLQLYSNRYPREPSPDLLFPRKELRAPQRGPPLLKDIFRGGQTLYQELSGEVEHCYYEAKEKLGTISGGK